MVAGLCVRGTVHCRGSEDGTQPKLVFARKFFFLATYRFDNRIGTLIMVSESACFLFVTALL